MFYTYPIADNGSNLRNSLSLATIPQFTLDTSVANKIPSLPDRTGILKDTSFNLYIDP